MPRKDEELDLAPLRVGPGLERTRDSLFLADAPQVGVGVVHAVLQLPECPVVVVQAAPPADLHPHVRGRDVLRQRIGLGDFSLTQADGVHPRAKIHPPDGLRAQLTDVELQIRGA